MVGWKCWVGRRDEENRVYLGNLVIKHTHLVRCIRILENNISVGLREAGCGFRDFMELGRVWVQDKLSNNQG